MSQQQYDDVQAQHVTRLENLKVAVCNLQTAVFQRGIHHVDAEVRYNELIDALNRVIDRKNI